MCYMLKLDYLHTSHEISTHDKRKYQFQTDLFSGLCCWWYVVLLVAVHEDLDNDMVLTWPALFICCLASKDSWKYVK